MSAAIIRQCPETCSNDAAQALKACQAARSIDRFFNYFFFFGAMTMIIWRPSIFGICST
jgi:hypothetical protein